jgi:serine/threonine protein kinase
MPTNLVGDRYELIEILGEGGFAVTHRAWDSRLDRPVAIKLLRPHFAANEIFVQRFVREARAAASVSHPNVVRLYDFGDEGGVVYIAMQYVLGETLRDLLRRFPRGLTLATALQLFRGVLSGLGAVHAAGIVHRDIKPDNVLLDREGRPLITDFGIALLGDQLRLTTAETAYGTAAYMAPEQARGEETGPGADLYSAGDVGAPGATCAKAFADRRR